MQGGKPAYSESFNVADIYPIAHYLWPATSTYLTNQHNIVLTLFTGGILELSNQWTGSKDWGLIIASGLQAVFALFCYYGPLFPFCTAGIYIRPCKRY